MMTLGMWGLLTTGSAALAWCLIDEYLYHKRKR